MIQYLTNEHIGALVCIITSAVCEMKDRHSSAMFLLVFVIAIKICL